MKPTGLDNATDPAIEALSALAKTAVNESLETVLGTDAIRNVYAVPLPLSLLLMGNLPALSIYRLEDRETDKGDWMFEEVTTYRFDYYSPATAVSRIDKRWPILRSVWAALLPVLREGRHPSVADGQPMGVGRYVLGSGRVQYTFVPGAEQTYLSFRGQVQLEGTYEPIVGWDGGALSDFDTLWTDWDLPPESNVDLEAQNETKPNG